MSETAQDSRWHRLVRVTGVYGAVGFVILQLADILLPAFELPETLISYMVIALVGGFPLTLIVAWLNYKAPDTSGTNTSHAQLPTSRRTQLLSLVSVAFVVAFLTSAGGFFWYEQTEQSQAEYEEQLASIDALISRGNYTQAFLIMQEMDIPSDETRDEYAERIVVPGIPKIANDNVSVSFKPFNKPDVDWYPIGKTPFTEKLALPRGDLHMKLEAEGYITRELVVKNPGPIMQNGLYFAVMGDKLDQAPVPMDPISFDDDNKTRLIPESIQPVFLLGWTRDVLARDTLATTPAFRVHTFEVSNREFRAFITDGGYSNPDYWQGLDFTLDGRPLTFAEASEHFVDLTGRPGPSEWSLSTYPEGEAELPVGGISWYEAVAYSRYRGLSLPTLYQWTRYAFGPLEGFYPLAGAVANASHFNGKAPIPASEQRGLGPWGTFNTAGNMREWVLNETTNGLGLIQGSSWVSYGNYEQAITADRMDRYKTNGLRLVDNLGEPVPTIEPLNLVFDSPHSRREPVSDDAYNLMRSQFHRPPKKVDDVKIEILETNDLWSIEEHLVSYTDESVMTIYVFKPTTQGPYPSVLFATPGNAYTPGRSNRDAIGAHLTSFDYILRGGRAVVMPIWFRSYERYKPSGVSVEEFQAGNILSAHTWHEDAVTTIDYMETLSDLDTSNLTYAGISYGAAVYGQMVTALEDRITNAIYISGGIVHTREYNPILDGINYLPRITKPVLMLNGDQDHIFGWEGSSVRSFNLLGTPPDQKKLIRYQAGHISFDRNLMVRDVSDWLDEHAPISR